jgi:hypothetical protein
VTPATQRERGNRSQDVVAALHAQNERLRLENERLRMLLEEKGAQIAELEERVARLERLATISAREGDLEGAVFWVNWRTNSTLCPWLTCLAGEKTSIIFSKIFLASIHSLLPSMTTWPT